jgi:uncharacterized protein YjbI with pentapeptide repeats
MSLGLTSAAGSSTTGSSPTELRWRSVPAKAIRAALLRSDCSTSPSGLQLQGASIVGSLDLSRAKVACPIVLTDCYFDSPIVLDRADLALVDLSDSTFPALTAVGAKFSASVIIERVAAQGAVSFLGCKISGSLLAQGATINAKGQVALSIEGARVERIINLMETRIRGAVRGHGAEIDGQIRLNHASLENDGMQVIGLDNARIANNLDMSGMTATGPINLSGASLSSFLIMRDSIIEPGRESYSIYAEGLIVNHLDLTGADKAMARVVLRAAQINSLRTPLHGVAWSPGILVAQGWKINAAFGALVTDRRAASRWLGSDLLSPFSPQPWHELANLYESHGQLADARWLRIKAARRTTRAAPWYGKLSRWLYGGLVGHGYRPWLAAAWLIVVIVATSLLVDVNARHFAPSAPSAAAMSAAAPVLQRIDGETSSSDLNPNYPTLQPALYSIDFLLPVSSGAQVNSWRVTDAASVSISLAVLKIVAWVLGALLLAGVTGLLRRT